MKNEINETEDDFQKIVKETVEKLKGKNYTTVIAFLEHVKRNIENVLTLN